MNLLDSYNRNAMVLVHGMLALEMLRYGKAMGYSQSEAASYSPDGADSGTHSPDGVASRIPSPSIQESLLAPMVRLLVMCGARFPAAHQQTSFMKSADWMIKLYEDRLDQPQNNLLKPGQLVNTCRLEIRRHMAKISKLHCLDRLPLPGHLIDYIQIKYM